MLHKEAAIAVMVALMLGISSLLGGFSMLPALATHDPDAVQVVRKQISQDSNQTATISAIELVAKKSTLRASGTLTVEVIQGGDVLASAKIGGSELSTTYRNLEAELNEGIEVQGDFEILVEYLGSGVITVSDIGLINGTQIADEEEEENGGDENENSGPTETAEQQLEGIQVARKTIQLDEDQKMDVETVEFVAKKSTLRASGTITVAIVQDGKVLDTDAMPTNGMSTLFKDAEANFDVQVTGIFQVVFMYEGSGSITVNSIGVPGETMPAEDSEETPTDKSPMVELTVESEDENGNELFMFITIWQGFNSVATGTTPIEFELEDGEYTVQAHDYDDAETNTHIHFVEWADSDQDTAFRFADLTDFDEETFTAIYDTGGTEPAGEEETPADGGETPSDETPNEEDPAIEDPAPGGPNTVTVQSTLLDGTDASGKLAQLRASNGDNVQEGFTTAELTLEEGETFNVIMYSFGDEFFRKWSDGHLHRYLTVEGDGTAYALTALYERVPVDQQAKLQINARTADGQPIGGTTGTAEDGTLEAIPGVEVQIAPPNSMTPFTAYTAGFSGGSEIAEQFYFFDGQTYVVIMQSFGQYEFSHWEDNGSGNSARAVALNGDTTLTAIYNVVE